MKAIWFKQKYVSPILSGEKADTIRDGDQRHKFAVGDTLNASVGSRPAFARLKVEAVELINIDNLPVERGLALLNLYPNTKGVMTRIAFSVLP